MPWKCFGLTLDTQEVYALCDLLGVGRFVSSSEDIVFTPNTELVLSSAECGRVQTLNKASTFTL